MGLKIYDAGSVKISVGTFSLESYAEGTFVTIVRDEDSFTKNIGADGEPARAKSNNKGGSITCVLQQTSPSNLLLSALHQLDEISPAGDGVVPTLVEDLQGTSLFTAAESWIKKGPSAEYAADITVREWVIDTGNLVAVYGGNNAPP